MDALDNCPKRPKFPKLSKVLDNWTKTSLARYRALLSKATSVHEYMEHFPAFRDEMGYILVSHFASFNKKAKSK